MFYVYVLHEPNKDRRYIGYTHDLRRRLKEHNDQRNTGYTQRGEWHLVYYEAFIAEEDARSREKRLKKDGRARYQLMKRIRKSIEKVG